MSRWTEDRINEWYKQQPWLVGANFAPGYASNQIEMWQEITFDPKRIELELSWARDLGFNTMRIFLHDLLWQQDAEGFKKRFDQVLGICEKFGIRAMPVLFDSVWDPNPKLGPQREPIWGVHNSGWVQGPGMEALQDPAQYPRLQAYVEDIVRTFAHDKRIVVWDIWNEPDNMNGSSYGPTEPKNKHELVAPLLEKAFAWARAQNPDQPLTSGVWIGHWDGREPMNPIWTIQLAQSDIISFHNYGKPEDIEERILYLQKHNRPLLCTEYMARTLGSTFADVLPILKKYKVGAYNWGFVQGRTQTHLPWDSWQNRYEQDPPVWFHEVLRNDGKPYREDEVAVIKEITKAASTKAA